LKEKLQKKQTTLQVDGLSSVIAAYRESRQALRESLRKHSTIRLPKPPVGFGRCRLFEAPSAYGSLAFGVVHRRECGNSHRLI
jgi:hypothetical protein